MMDTGSDCSLLHEMFQKALKDPQDEFAVSMFATMIRNDLTLIPKAIKLILDKVKANDIPQSLRALEVLEECMSKSGVDFQSEISKYRFLNELSKLVSIKHMGNETLKEIKDKIMDCFLLWTAQYPDKEKIKSVYDCLKKEGVQDTAASNNMSIDCAYQRKSDLMDEENEKKFKRLLQSTCKEDVKKANLLVQHLFKQNEKTRERVLKQKTELKEIFSTVQVFNQVIDNYIKEKPEDDETASLLEELYQSCAKYKKIVGKMPDIMKDSEEELIRDTIQVNEMLLEVIAKYKNIDLIINGRKIEISDEIKNSNINIVAENSTNQAFDDLLSVSLDQPNIGDPILSKENPLDELAEIFSPNLTSSCLTPAPANKNENPGKLKLVELNTTLSPQKSILSAIDDLSADLFNKHLNSLPRTKTFTKESSKVPLNQLSKLTISPTNISDTEKTSIEEIETQNTKEMANICMPSINEVLLSKNGTESQHIVIDTQTSDVEMKPKISYLSQVEINFDEIKPSNAEQIVLLNNKDGLKITLDFTINKPLDYTSVIVISSTNQSQLPIDDFLFDAFVHKPCKLRLLQRNGNFLPGVKPFCPPVDCLHQILLIYNPTENHIDVTFTYSYVQGEDPDPIKGSLIKSIPYLK